MLGKLVWNLAYKPQSLAARVFKEKYYPKSHILDAKRGSAPSFVWSGIFSAKEELKSGFKWVVGDGNDISVGKDSWIRGKVGFRLDDGYEFVNEMRVSQLFNPNSRTWDETKVRTLFSEEDARHILNIRIPQYQCRDRLSWVHSKDGLYTVKSGYQIWQGRGNQQGMNGSSSGWKRLWKLQGRCNAIPITCPMCNNDAEHLHVFFEKTPEFLKMNPMGKVPVLETTDGTVFGSNAIARYVTKLNHESSLFGSSPVDYGHVEQWIDFTALEIDANIASCLYPRYGFAVYLPLAEEAAIAALKRALGGLNTHLASTTYLVGHSVTLADIVLACNLATGFKEILTKSFTSEFPHVERYFWTMVNQPNFSKIMGKLEQAETRMINDLSTELIGEILKRLPVKYIIRCSSMKKSWYDFIRSPHFNKLHMNHQLASPGDGFLFFKTVSRNSHNIRRDNVGCEFPCSSSYPEELHQKIWCEHSNGILCITYPNEWYASCKIHLFNPVVNKHKTLPGPPIALQSTPLWHALAFGYIPAVDDYCVVCITKPRGKSNSLSISVYNLISNSWRNFQQDLAIIDIDSDHSFFVNNVAYWLGNSLEGVQLVCFDTTSDTLRFLDLPDEFPGDGFGNFGRMKGARGWKYRHVIRSTGQSVAYFRGTLHWDTLYVHVLGDYDIWELKFNVALNGILIREKVLGIRKNGDLILRESDGLVTVDLVNQVRTEFFDLRQLERRPNAAASPTLINPFMENLLFFDEPKKEAAKPRVEEAPEEEAPKAKAGKALDALPPSKMILDEWKRLYSNTKTNFRETVKGFWDMFDPEGYSLWLCKYKYNEENMVSSVTLNKVGGFLQSMDLAREYAFGKMLVIGSQPPYKVWGLWLFLGKDIPQFVMDECHDMKLYEWTQVDINDEAQKERASEMIEARESFEGDDLLETKCFK